MKRIRTDYNREYMRKRRLDPKYREKIAKQAREKYKNPEVRKKRLEHCKKWESKNKEKRKIYKRMTRLIVNGKSIQVKKRDFQGYCELCGKQIEKRPKWHHWDDEHPELGLWLCSNCHWYVAEAVEYDPIDILRNKYRQIKEGYILAEIKK